jgi:YD repeat-containing protein
MTKRTNILFPVLSMLCLVVSSSLTAQFYYKDIVSTSQINNNFRVYKMNKVSGVKLNSFDGNMPVTEGFLCEQKVNIPRNQLITYTKTSDAGETFLTAAYNAKGFLNRTVDSSEETVSTSTFKYDDADRLVELNINTRASDNSSSTSERHVWEYNVSGKPVKMTRIRNNSDSTTVVFVLDEKGNVAEEEVFRKGASQGKVYYYYDEQNRLTDVVRYNVKARRLLPDYIFEYEDDELSAMTVVPEGTDNYQKWYYKYDENGLKQVDFCFDKKNELLGKIEYVYQFGK